MNLIKYKYGPRIFSCGAPRQHICQMMNNCFCSWTSLGFNLVYIIQLSGVSTCIYTIQEMFTLMELRPLALDLFGFTSLLYYQSNHLLTIPIRGVFRTWRKGSAPVGAQKLPETIDFTDPRGGRVSHHIARYVSDSFPFSLQPLAGFVLIHFELNQKRFFNPR